MAEVRADVGWAGSVEEFLAARQSDVIASLAAHHRGLLAMKPSPSQLAAWEAEHNTLTAAFTEILTRRPEAAEWGVVFEYELPLEGGRRPDVIVHTGGSIALLEFKVGAGIATPGAIDQVLGYARDLSEYHEASRNRTITPILVTSWGSPSLRRQQVRICTPSGVATELLAAARPGYIDLKEWLRSPYVPLPSLVEAARRIFQHEPLPHVRRAESAGIPETVALIGWIIDQAQANQERRLVFVTGVPGSGKTLVGLRVVYEQAGDEAISTFLSGNGPLVKVLSDALGSRVFVRDLHAFIKTYGLTERTPRQHILVFDEAQRAWDKGYMSYKRGIEASEAELLLRIGSELSGWAVLVGLVGDGQEIYSGEEGGIEQWAEALRSLPNRDDWAVHAPPRLTSTFDHLKVTAHPELDLTISLRSRRAEQLHAWVGSLLDADLAEAARLAADVRQSGFSLYVTDNLESAKAYLDDRYAGEPNRRYGLVASSHAKTLPQHGIDNSWLTTSRVKPEQWFNAPPDAPESCCALVQPVTEFGCQGLELDMAVVCWGEDLVWENGWQYTPIRRRYPQDDPNLILRNVYRVLLTRGRDGLIVFVPPDPVFLRTREALKAAGMVTLERVGRNRAPTSGSFTPTTGPPPGE